MPSRPPILDVTPAVTGVTAVTAAVIVAGTALGDRSSKKQRQ